MPRRQLPPILPLYLLLAFTAPTSLYAADLTTLPYRDTSLPFEKRVADLISRMTPQEKAAQILVHADANLRLGIPPIDWWTEGNHGLSNRGPAGNVTVFPQAIAMAATFDPPLIKKIGEATADEARARYEPGIRYRGLGIWAPTINLARDPRWGRVEETYGEDPYLTGRLAIAMVQGMQGDDPRYLKVQAVPKHFAMHSQETSRFSRSFDCPEPILRDYYFPAFRDAFIEGHAAGTMTAFSGINGIPNTANPWLLTTVLRDEWHFDGMAVSDNGGVTQLYTGQRYVKSEKEAITAALNAGLDVIATFEPRDYYSYIDQALNDGSLKTETLDRALAHNLLVRFRLGMFDPPSLLPFKTTPATNIGSPQHLATALKTAQESFILLKNDPAPKGYGFEKLLPLDLRRISSIAIVGPYAKRVPNFGAYSGTPAGPCPTFYDGIRMALGERVNLRYADYGDIDSAVKIARESDLVLFIGGLDSTMEREGMDRGSLALPIDQQLFITRITTANPLTILILQTGSPIALPSFMERAPAALLIWYSGEQGAIALGQALTGQINPGGKLPITFYRADADLPPLDDYDITKGRTYMYLQKSPTFPFGHGLSYTTFDYRNLKVTPLLIPPAISGSTDAQITITLDIANTGPADGDEVVQLYIRQKTPPASAPYQRPLKQLKAFQRISIPKGQTQSLTLTLPLSKLAFWNPQAHAYTVDPGPYELQLGSSSQDIRLTTDINIQ